MQYLDDLGQVFGPGLLSLPGCGMYLLHGVSSSPYAKQTNSNVSRLFLPPLSSLAILSFNPFFRLNLKRYAQHCEPLTRSQ